MKLPIFKNTSIVINIWSILYHECIGKKRHNRRARRPTIHEASCCWLNTTTKSQSSKMQTTAAGWIVVVGQGSAPGNMALSQLPTISEILWHYYIDFAFIKASFVAPKENITCRYNFVKLFNSLWSLIQKYGTRMRKRLLASRIKIQLVNTYPSVCPLSETSSSMRRGICDASKGWKNKIWKNGGTEGRIVR